MNTRELAERSHQGLVVRLLWAADTNELLLSYDDERLGDRFEVVIDHRRALDAFNHPNCYRPAISDATLSALLGANPSQSLLK